MIREGDKDTQNIKETPKCPYIKFKSLRTYTNRMKNEERTKNDVEVDHGHNSILPRPNFSPLSSSL